MRLVKIARCGVLLIAVLFFLTPHAGAQNDVGSEARRIAGAANDKAASAAERQMALHQLHESLRLFLLGGEQVEAARVLNRLGRLELITNNPEEAVAAHNEALGRLQQDTPVEVKVDSFNGLAAAYLRLQKQTEAKQASDRAVELSRNGGYLAGEAQALLIASELENYNDHMKAMQLAEKSRQLWQQTTDKDGLARSHYQIGEYSLAQSKLFEAEHNYQTALQLWREDNNERSQASALIGLGFVEFRKAEWEKTFAFLSQAQSLIDEKSEPAMAGQIAGGLAATFNEVGMPEQGLLQYQRVLEYFQQAKSPIDIGYATRGIGWTNYLQQNYPEAIKQLESAAALGGSGSILAAQCDELLGRVYWNICNPPSGFTSGPAIPRRKRKLGP
jgi:tetratricopeptide (TPR) repeat protein